MRIVPLQIGQKVCGTTWRQGWSGEVTQFGRSIARDEVMAIVTLDESMRSRVGEEVTHLILPLDYCSEPRRRSSPRPGQVKGK